MIAVLLVDDHALVRRGLRTLLEAEEDLQVVAEAEDGLAALALIADAAPQVALVDARMPRMDGVSLIARLSADHPQVACILLTTFDQEDYVVGALRAGARGHFLKDADPEELLEGIRRVASGRTVLGESAAEHLVERLRTGTGPRMPDSFAGAERLTERERDVARLVASGHNNREIARALHITEGTVKNHVSAALRKLDLADRTRLAVHIAKG